MEEKKLWYVVNAYSGHEQKVKDYLESRRESMGMENNIFRVIIPERTEVEIKSSGKGAKPIPLSPEEVKKFIGDGEEKAKPINTNVEVGDMVSIIDGPFKGMSGKIESEDKENEKLTVLIDLFGQETPVEVDLIQVTKM